MLTFKTIITRFLFSVNTKMEKKATAFPWKRTLAAAAAVLLIAGGTAASYLNGWGLDAPAKKAGRQAVYEAEELEYAAEEAYEYDGGAPMMAAGTMFTAKRTENTSATMDTGAAKQAKIIRTINLSLRTRSYESDYQTIRTLADQAGGRVESLSTLGDGSADSLRWASFTLRIPTDRLDTFISGAKAVGVLDSFTESSDDVSESYYDTQSRLETQQAKMERLNELMEKAENVSDLVELENAISDTQYWIDYYTGRINGYDSRISDSYVYVTLQEMSSADVADQKDIPLGERIANAVKASLKTAGNLARAFVVFLVAALPWLAAIAVAVGIVLLIRRGRKKKQ